MKKIFSTLRLLHHTVGVRIQHLFLFFFILINSFLSDLFRQKKTRQIKKPIFLIGHLRSGTTFLHRLLGKADGLCGMTLERMIFGSGPYGKWIHKLMGQWLKQLSLDSTYDPKKHKTGFDLLESDDIAFYFQRFGGLLYWIYFVAWKEFGKVEDLKSSILEAAGDTGFLEQQHNLYAAACSSEKRMFSKSFFGIYQLEDLRKRYPDARFLILLRDPKEVIASTLSLEIGIQGSLNKFAQQPKQLQQRYLQNIYAEVRLYYDQLDKCWLQKNADTLFVRYEELKENFEPCMRQIIHFCDLQDDKSLLEAIEIQARRQTNFTSKHQYSLADYGINEQDVERDFSSFYQRRSQQQSESSGYV